MKGTFTLKISDLLQNIGSDRVVFDEQGMKGVLELYALDGKSVLVKVKDFEKNVESVCDRCAKTFMREIRVPEYVAKYTLDKKEFEESEEDVLFLIDEKNQTIDVEELLYQVTISEDPFVLKCPECQEATADLEDDEDEEE